MKNWYPENVRETSGKSSVHPAGKRPETFGMSGKRPGNVQYVHGKRPETFGMSGKRPESFTLRYISGYTVFHAL